MLDQRQLMSSSLKISFMSLRTIYLVMYFHSSFTNKKTEKKLRDTWWLGCLTYWIDRIRGGPRPSICCSKENDGEHLATYCSHSISMVLISQTAVVSQWGQVKSAARVDLTVLKTHNWPRCSSFLVSHMLERALSNPIQVSEQDLEEPSSDPKLKDVFP